MYVVAATLPQCTYNICPFFGYLSSSPVLHSLSSEVHELIDYAQQVSYSATVVYIPYCLHTIASS